MLFEKIDRLYLIKNRKTREAYEDEQVFKTLKKNLKGKPIRKRVKN